MDIKFRYPLHGTTPILHGSVLVPYFIFTAEPNNSITNILSIFIFIYFNQNIVNPTHPIQVSTIRDLVNMDY